MGRQKGFKKTKTMGRKKGTPNKRTWDLIKTLEEKGYDPAANLVRLAIKAEKQHDALHKSSENAPQFLKIAKDATSDLMKYVYPQRKAVDVTSGGEKLQTITDIFAAVVNGKRSDSAK